VKYGNIQVDKEDDKRININSVNANHISSDHELL